MLIVDTYLDKSPIHGIGLFANQDIKKGRKVWKLDYDVDRIFFNQSLRGYNKFTKAYIKKYGYLSEQHEWILCGDNTKFMNHSNNPNVISKNCDIDFAARDIKAGEELTIDYFTFDLDAKNKLK